jgi:signal transduction histidine kinase
MSAIAFRRANWDLGGSGRLRQLDVAWTVFAVGMVVLMKARPEVQTIPYHFIFVSFTLLYGFRLWSPRVTGAMLIAITLVTGILFVDVYLDGRVSIDELAEVPLMPAIVAVMAWHAWRRAGAQRRVEKLVTLEGSRLDRQREFLRDASHAIRTPVTIARGQVELLRAGLAREDQSDVDEVLHQLDRLHHLAVRLLTIEQLETAEQLLPVRIDIARFVSATERRWSQAVTRRWELDARHCGLVLADVHGLEEALDALVENAVRFTKPSDAIRLGCRREAGWIVLEVSDSGPGVPEHELTRIFERFYHRHPSGQEPGTGLGLALVQAVAIAHGGAAAAARSDLGGAQVVLRLPPARQPTVRAPGPAA